MWVAQAICGEELLQSEHLERDGVFHRLSAMCTSANVVITGAPPSRSLLLSVAGTLLTQQITVRFTYGNRL